MAVFQGHRLNQLKYRQVRQNMPRAQVRVACLVEYQSQLLKQLPRHHHNFPLGSLHKQETLTCSRRNPVDILTPVQETVVPFKFNSPRILQAVFDLHQENPNPQSQICLGPCFHGPNPTCLQRLRRFFLQFKTMMSPSLQEPQRRLKVQLHGMQATTPK